MVEQFIVNLDTELIDSIDYGELVRQDNPMEDLVYRPIMVKNSLKIDKLVVGPEWTAHPSDEWFTLYPSQYQLDYFEEVDVFVPDKNLTILDLGQFEPVLMPTPIERTITWYNANNNTDYNGMKAVRFVLLPVELGPLDYQQEITTNGEHIIYKTNDIMGMSSVKFHVNVPNGGGQLQSKRFNISGTAGVVALLPDEGYIGFSSVILDVETMLQSNYSLTVTQNGIYNIMPDTNQGYQGISYGSLTVNVGENLQTKSLNVGGSVLASSPVTYYPDSGYQGFSSITVTQIATPLMLVDETITENGTYHYENPNNNYAIREVDLTVNVQPPLQAGGGTVTQNGTYTYAAQGNYYGLSRVEVNVVVAAHYVKYISLANQVTAAGTINLDTDYFDRGSNGQVFTVQPGKTIIFIRFDSGSCYIVPRGNPSSFSTDLVFTGNFNSWAYKELNYDVGNFIYVLDNNGIWLNGSYNYYRLGEAQERTGQIVLNRNMYNIPNILIN